MADWPDIPGVTAVEGLPRLPREPDVTIAILIAALHGVHTADRTLSGLTALALSRCRTERSRVEGLLSWLPLSRVATWTGGQLALDPATDLVDLTLRFAAWAGSQAVQPADRDGLVTYTRALAEAATTSVKRGDLPPNPPAGAFTPVSDTPAALPEVAPVTDALLLRVHRLIASLDASFLERRQQVRASLLALLAGQHVLLLGPPGTAKSLLARALCESFDDARYFEYLLSRFTHPDELFGPVSIPGLKEEDYRRITEGFLPQAHIGFLDEIFKANSAILNSLLTLINERTFHHGKHRDPSPLIGIVGASNELPDPEGGLGALYDRFLIRLTVPPLAEAAHFLAVATGSVAPPSIPADARLALTDLAQIRTAAEQIRVPDEVQSALLHLWRQAHARDWEVSDRRWRHALTLLKVAAATDGREALSLLDLLLLELVLPPDPDRVPEVRDVILEPLAQGSVPSHDLRAQWALLVWDRVASAPDQPYTRLGTTAGLPWREHLPLRRANLTRFLAHHEAAVQRLSRDRARVERAAEQHTWIASLPAQVLARHLESARDLARILNFAEVYRHELTDAAALTRASFNRLPRTPQRVYGMGAVCAVFIEAAGITEFLTLAGEREPPPDGTGATAAQAASRRNNLGIPELHLSPEQWLDLLDGSATVEYATRSLPAHAQRNAQAALHSARRTLGNTAIVAPPTLPSP